MRLGQIVDLFFVDELIHAVGEPGTRTKFFVFLLLNFPIFLFSELPFFLHNPNRRCAPHRRRQSGQRLDAVSPTGRPHL